MNRIISVLAIAVITAIGMTMPVAAQQKGLTINVDAPAPNQRLALVITNQAYDAIDYRGLRNPANDGTEMSKVLRDTLGYKVTELSDKDLDGLISGVHDFAARVGKDSTVVVYYSGHGITLEGERENRIMPVDFPAANSLGSSGNPRTAKSKAKRNSVALAADLLSPISEKNPNGLVVFYDACRNNPIKGQGVFKTAVQQSSFVPARVDGTVIFYAARHGEQALDRLNDADPRRLSLFTRVLSDMLRRDPTIRIRDMQVDLSAEVSETAQRIGHIQQPAVEGALRYTSKRREFCLATKGGQCGFEGNGATGGADLTRIRDDAVYKVAKLQNTKEAWLAYLTTFPNGRHRTEANQQLSIFEAASKSASVTVPPVSRPSMSAAQAGSTFRDCVECPEMVRIPGGSFRMGDLSGDGYKNEKPVRTVILRGFSAGKYEVTWKEWEACVRGGGCDGSGPQSEGGDEGWGKGRRPVINVSWEDAQSYGRWISGKTGKDYRLLSESEWEYMARAGSVTKYPWGNTASHEQANYYGATGSDQWVNTSPVGSFSANRFGVYDVIGNVWEWTEDCYHESYSGAPVNEAAWTSGECKYRVERGGAWSGDSRLGRSAIRDGYTPSVRVNSVGFRLARTD